jgi:hypothetical protein
MAKAKYYQTKIEKAQNDAKASWKIIREILHSKGTKQDLPSKFTYDGVEINTQKEIANVFNDFFVKRPESYLLQNHNQSIFLGPVNETDIKTCAKKLKSKLSQGHEKFN